MTFQQIIELSKENLGYMTGIRRKLHRIPGVGFENRETVACIEEQLSGLGISSERCGKCGLVAVIGKGRRCILLRADTDGLPTAEETGLEYASENGRMHACGHDMHAAMLLGAAKLLKEHEDELCGCVKLMFQSAEETLCGAKDMIEAGVLKAPVPDNAMMLHVMTGVPMKTGTLIVSAPGVSAPAADFFEIEVCGKGCHGSSPAEGADPLYSAACIVTALSEISSRELAMSEQAILTFGSFNAGTAANVIPDRAVLSGTLRCFDEEVRDRVKSRLCEISGAIASAFRTTAQVKFTAGCPSLYNDRKFSELTLSNLRNAFGEDRVFSSHDLGGDGKNTKTSGSEDFAYISREIPSVMIAVAAGEPEKGHIHPVHHPKATFDERALAVGCAAFCANALGFFNS